jgi:hypothetical protein
MPLIWDVVELTSGEFAVKPGSTEPWRRVFRCVIDLLVWKAWQKTDVQTGRLPLA